jgi:hypothetical protein
LVADLGDNLGHWSDTPQLELPAPSIEDLNSIGASSIYLPRLFVYHCLAEPGSVQSETFKGQTSTGKR